MKADNLINSDERFRLLVESVEDYAIFILDPHGVVTTWNSGAERIKGYRPGEIVGRHFSAFYPPEDVQAGKCERVLAAARREGRFHDEGWRIRKDGSRMWASVTITALRDDARQLVGFAKVTRDLTERHAAEEETRRFRLLVESVKDYAIFMLDAAGHVSTWNVGAQRIKGYGAEEIIGKHFSTFYPRQDVDAGKCEMELDVAAREGRFEDEGWRVRKDGSRFWANVIITALRDSRGGLVGFAKVTRDLTERRQAEEARRLLAAERAAFAEKARIADFQERFLGVLGHDLRNPLASIDMGQGILRQRVRDPTEVRILDRMHASAQRMSRMIEQILDLTRARLAGGLDLRRAPMDLRDTLTATVDELRGAYPSGKIDLRCPALPGCWDRDRLEQVFSNLIGNALAHGDASAPVTVTGALHAGVADVQVHNQGPPISPELQPVLFDAFRRGAGDGRSKKTAGLGLGLYISSEVVRAHGGRIELRSTLAEGTTFTVMLPLETP